MLIICHGDTLIYSEEKLRKYTLLLMIPKSTNIIDIVVGVAILLVWVTNEQFKDSPAHLSIICHGDTVIYSEEKLRK